jgi:peptide/nickel transport system permease protein
MTIHPLIRFLFARTGLLGVTLALSSVMVFMTCQVLPGNLGRTLLGPLADARAVATINRQFGTDRPLQVQYWDWLSHAAAGHFGTSLALRVPVAPLLLDALKQSALLATVALGFIVPVGIGAGICAALRANSVVDRAIVLTSVSVSIVPEFVTALTSIMVFGLWLRWLPVDGSAPDGAGFWTRVHYLVLPTLPLVLVYTGYIARMARAGTIDALNSDYARTAVLKGLSAQRIVVYHVLRNALIPTLTVIATQIGYLLGGLVVIESLFHIQGLGNLILSAAKAHDFPVLEAAVMTMATVYTVSAAAGDLLHALLDPRIRRAGVA